MQGGLVGGICLLVFLSSQGLADDTDTPKPDDQAEPRNGVSSQAYNESESSDDLRRDLSMSKAVAYLAASSAGSSDSSGKSAQATASVTSNKNAEIDSYKLPGLGSSLADAKASVDGGGLYAPGLNAYPYAPSFPYNLGPNSAQAQAEATHTYQTASNLAPPMVPNKLESNGGFNQPISSIFVPHNVQKKIDDRPAGVGLFPPGLNYYSYSPKASSAYTQAQADGGLHQPGLTGSPFLSTYSIGQSFPHAQDHANSESYQPIYMPNHLNKRSYSSLNANPTFSLTSQDRIPFGFDNAPYQPIPIPDPSLSYQMEQYKVPRSVKVNDVGKYKQASLLRATDTTYNYKSEYGTGNVPYPSTSGSTYTAGMSSQSNHRGFKHQVDIPDIMSYYDSDMVRPKPLNSNKPKTDYEEYQAVPFPEYNSKKATGPLVGYSPSISQYFSKTNDFYLNPYVDLKSKDDTAKVIDNKFNYDKTLSSSLTKNVKDKYFKTPILRSQYVSVDSKPIGYELNSYPGASKSFYSQSLPFPEWSADEITKHSKLPQYHSATNTPPHFFQNMPSATAKNMTLISKLLNYDLNSSPIGSQSNHNNSSHEYQSSTNSLNYFSLVGQNRTPPPSVSHIYKERHDAIASHPTATRSSQVVLPYDKVKDNIPNSVSILSELPRIHEEHDKVLTDASTHHLNKTETNEFLSMLSPEQYSSSFPYLNSTEKTIQYQPNIDDISQIYRVSKSVWNPTNYGPYKANSSEPADAQPYINVKPGAGGGQTQYNWGLSTEEPHGIPKSKTVGQSSLFPVYDAKSRLISSHEFIFPNKMRGAENVVQCTKENQFHHFWTQGTDCMVCICLNEYGILTPVCATCGGCKNIVDAKPIPIPPLPEYVPVQTETPRPIENVPFIPEVYPTSPIETIETEPSPTPPAPPKYPEHVPMPHHAIEPLPEYVVPATLPPLPLEATCNPLPSNQPFTNPLHPCQICICNESYSPEKPDVQISCKENPQCVTPADVTTMPPIPEIPVPTPLPMCEKFPEHVLFPHPTDTCRLCKCSKSDNIAGNAEQQITCYPHPDCLPKPEPSKPPPVPAPISPGFDLQPVPLPELVTAEPLPWPPTTTIAPIPSPRPGPLPGPSPHESCAPYPPNITFQHPWDECQICLCTEATKTGLITVEVSCYTKPACCIEPPEAVKAAISALSAQNLLSSTTFRPPQGHHYGLPPTYSLSNLQPGTDTKNPLFVNPPTYPYQAQYITGYANPQFAEYAAKLPVPANGVKSTHFQYPSYAQFGQGDTSLYPGHFNYDPRLDVLTGGFPGLYPYDVLRQANSQTAPPATGVPKLASAPKQQAKTRERTEEDND